MKVLFTVFPGTAHVYPIVPLAWALKNAGHEVRVAIHPGAANIVTAAGLTAVPFGTHDHMADVVEFNTNLDKLNLLDNALALDTERSPEWESQWFGLTHILTLFTPILPDLVDITRSWRPDLVIWDPFCVAGAVAARVSGAAHARFLWGQDNVGWLRAKSKQYLAARQAAPHEDPVSTLMRPMLEPYGLEYEEDLLLGQWSIDPMPPGMRLPLDLPYTGVRRIPFSGSTVVPDWLEQRPERPRVCLTLGIGGRGRQVFRASGVTFAEIVEAVAELDVELVATMDAKQRATVVNVPANVRLVEYVPLDVLLPTCSAVIHHGGGGTFAAAVAHQVPQLIVPMPIWSEDVTARYVANSGAGVVIDSDRLTASLLQKQLMRIIEEPSFRNGAAALHAEMQQTPSPADLVPVLEELTARHQR